MQMTFEQAFRPGMLSAFALKRGRGYMMRSERRPGYGSDNGSRNGGRRPPRKKKRAGLPYILLTLLISILIWPIGMIMLWRRKVRMQAGTKLLISLLTLCICVFLIVFALTVPVKNARINEFQDKAHDFLDRAEDRLGVVFDDVCDKGEVAWGDMKDFAGAAADYGLPKAADGLDAAVDFAARARSGITGLLGGEKDAASGAQTQPTPGADPTDAPTGAPESGEPTPQSSEATPAAGDTLDIARPGQTPDAAGAQALSAGLLNADGSFVPNETPQARIPTPEPTLEPAPDESAEPTPEPMTWTDAGNAVFLSYTPVVAEETPSGEDEVETVSPEPEKPETDQRAPETDAPQAFETDIPSDEPVVTDEPEAPAGEPTEAPVDVPTEAPTEAPVASADTPAPMIIPGATPAQAATATAGPQAPVVNVRAPGEATVYYFDESKLYHMAANCRGMSGAHPHTLSEAVAAGKRRCNTCGTPEGSILDETYVAWVDEENVIHTTDQCQSFEGRWRLMSLEEALSRDYAACRDCDGAVYVSQYVALSVTPTPAPTPEPDTVRPVVALKGAGEATVYHTGNGRFYHSRQVCGSMTGPRPYTLQSSVDEGFGRCTACLPPAPEMIGQPCLWMDENGLCHTTDECVDFDGRYTLILRDDALAQGLAGCDACGGDQYLIPGTVLDLSGQAGN